MFGPNLKSVALPVPEIIAIGVLGEGSDRTPMQSWGKGGRRGRDGTVRKSVGDFL